MNSENTKNVVAITNLTRQFDEQLALDDVSINVKSGQVFGIVGENGAGKTTLIKHMLGQYKAQQGTVTMFDDEPVASPEKVLAKIGYLSEEPELPAWMTVKEILNYTAAFYPTWDNDYAEQLIKAFSLNLDKRVRDLSKGQKARVGLVLAQAHKPELLLLDEPSSGLDPNVRRDILSAVIKTVSDEGRTVILSSHLLEEVERVCDHLMMLDKGRVLLFDSMEKVLNNHHRIIAKPDSGISLSDLSKFDGVFNAGNDNDEWKIDFYGDLEQLKTELDTKSVAIISNRLMSLNDIFISRTSASMRG